MPLSLARQWKNPPETHYSRHLRCPAHLSLATLTLGAPVVMDPAMNWTQVGSVPAQRCFHESVCVSAPRPQLRSWVTGSVWEFKPPKYFQFTENRSQMVNAQPHVFGVTILGDLCKLLRDLIGIEGC